MAAARAAAEMAAVEMAAVGKAAVEKAAVERRVEAIEAVEAVVVGAVGETADSRVAEERAAAEKWEGGVEGGDGKGSGGDGGGGEGGGGVRWWWRGRRRRRGWRRRGRQRRRWRRGWRRRRLRALHSTCGSMQWRSRLSTKGRSGAGAAGCSGGRTAAAGPDAPLAARHFAALVRRGAAASFPGSRSEPENFGVTERSSVTSPAERGNSPHLPPAPPPVSHGLPGSMLKLTQALDTGVRTMGTRGGGNRSG